MGSYRKGTQRRVKGRGGYAEDIGSGIGSWLGKKAGGLFSSIFGIGKYEVNKNSLLSASASDPPIVSNTASATRIQHREYITDITGSSLFALQAYNINPGLSATFPWLSTVANAFEEYKMHGLLFEFKSTSADALNSTNTALGTVIMATEYNALHAPFTAKRDMENYVYSTSSPPSVSALHPIECARDVSILDEFYVRNVPVPSSDIRFSDMGLFQLATVGMQASAVIGELWVTYDIELLKPKLPDSFTSSGPAHYVYNSAGPILPNPATSPPVSTNLFGLPSSARVALMGTGITPVTLNTNTITFNNVGRYLVCLNVFYVSAQTIATTSLTLGTGASTVNIQLELGAYNTYPHAGTSADSQSSFQTIDVTNVTNNVGTMTYGNNFGANIAYLELWVIPLPVGFSKYEEPEIAKIYNIIQSLTEQMKSFADESDFKDDGLPQESPKLIRARMDQSTTDLAALLASRLTGMP